MSWKFASGFRPDRIASGCAWVAASGDPPQNTPA
jgi:hypothetical protein